jgi:GH43 family beta-xylosidase
MIHFMRQIAATPATGPQKTNMIPQNESQEWQINPDARMRSRRWWSHAASRIGLPVALVAGISTCLVADTFTNPINEGADPWVVHHDGHYIWCKAEANQGISLWVSDRLHSFGEKHRIWTAPDEGPYSRQVWAPELHMLDGRWHVYFAASDGRNETHLTYVLRSETGDVLGDYQLHGPLATGDGPDRLTPNVWAIDMTVLEVGGNRYAVWSGWDEPGSDRQFLYIAAMKSPLELAGPRVRICANDDFLWERTEEREDSRGLHEGPQVLQHGGRTFLIYSCGASWLPTYKYGMLELTGDDPMDPASWHKFENPVFQSTSRTYGVGHGCFVKSPDGSEHWHIYHVKQDREPGWRRSIFVQPFTFTDEGLPDFGIPVHRGTPLPLRSGSPRGITGGPLKQSLKSETWATGFSYYGHHQFIENSLEGVILGTPPRHPVNAHRTGEKLILDHLQYADFAAEVTVSPINGGRDAGMLFRVSEPALGYDAQKGYFAGILTAADRVVLGKTDGRRWREIGRAHHPLVDGEEYRLRVTASGDRLAVSINGKTALEARDDSYRAGKIGLRVVDTLTRFSDLDITPENTGHRD